MNPPFLQHLLWRKCTTKCPDTISSLGRGQEDYPIIRLPPTECRAYSPLIILWEIIYTRKGIGMTSFWTVWHKLVLLVSLMERDPPLGYVLCLEEKLGLKTHWRNLFPVLGLLVGRSIHPTSVAFVQLQLIR